MQSLEWFAWLAWYPVWTLDQGMVWAWPWSRQMVWYRPYTDFPTYAEEAIYQYRRAL